MKKGISPLIAVVLLIAATVAVAAIMANWARTYSVGQLTKINEKSQQTECNEGMISFLTAIKDNPKIANNRIYATVQVDNVDLGNFTFEVIYYDSNNVPQTLTLKERNGKSIRAGSIATLESEDFPTGFDTTKIIKLRISTNCSNVKTEWRNV